MNASFSNSPDVSAQMRRGLPRSEQSRAAVLRTINGARRETVEKHIENCTKADPAYGEGVRKACEALGAL